MYFVALFIIVKNYYNKGNTGMPYPTTITAPSYLYAILGITSDFTEGLSTVLAAGLTLALFYRTHTGSDPIIPGTVKVSSIPKDKPKPKSQTQTPSRGSASKPIR